jgi:hypothetical protein
MFLRSSSSPHRHRVFPLRYLLKVVGERGARRKHPTGVSPSQKEILRRNERDLKIDPRRQIMNTIREIEKINQEELDRGIAGTSASWHAQYEKAPWVYIGNLDHELTEGDVLCVMSQFGEVSVISHTIVSALTRKQYARGRHSNAFLPPSRLRIFISFERKTRGNQEDSLF